MVSNRSPFLQGLQPGATLAMPIAHAEGNYFLEPDALKRVEDHQQIALRYRKNPNGSLHDIAGVTNEAGNVLGLMPHPERACEPLLGSADGLKLFQSLL